MQDFHYGRDINHKKIHLFVGADDIQFATLDAEMFGRGSPGFYPKCCKNEKYSICLQPLQSIISYPARNVFSKFHLNYLTYFFPILSDVIGSVPLIISTM